MKLTLSYPIQPVFITQRFGDTTFLEWYKAHGIVFKGHNGIDFMAYHGQPIYAAHDGTAYYEVDGSQGHGVVLITNQQYDYGSEQVYFKTIYWHMIDSAKEPVFKSPIEGHPYPNDGIVVKKGDLLGYANTTGLSSGDHLHFGLKPVKQGEPPQVWFNIEQ